MSTTDRLSGSLSSLAIKAPCRVATTANITLNGLQSIDGVTVVQDDRVLVKHQTSSVNNGIYLADSGDWVRAADFDGSFDVAKGTLINVNEGSTYANTQWSLSGTNPIVVGTTAVTFVESLSTTVNALALAYRRNYLYNGGMGVWQRGTSTTLCTNGARTFLADRWCVIPTGGDITQARSANVPSGSRARYSLRLDGGASVTTVNVQQRLPASDIPIIKRTVTFQCYVSNDTGGAFTPSLLLGTPTIADDFTTVNNRLTQTLQSCADATSTQVYHTVDISGYTDIDNGLQVELQIPDGSMLAVDTVRLTEIQLSPSSSVTAFDGLTFAEELARDMMFYEKSFAYATAPAQNVGSTAGAFIGQQITAGVATQVTTSVVQFKTRKRAAPTVTLFNPSAANAEIRNTGAGSDWSASGTSSVSETQIVFSGNSAGGSAAGNTAAVHWTASAEL